MRQRAAGAWELLPALCALAGCGQLVGIEDRRPHVVSLHGVAFDMSGPVEGGEICIPDVADDFCSVTDADGAFALFDVPATATHVVTGTSGLHFPFQAVLRFEDRDREIQSVFIRRSMVEPVLAPYGYDPTLQVGLVAFLLTSDEHDPTLPGVEGYAVTLEPGDAAVGPLQFTLSGTLISQPTTTKSGVGVFINVPPGSHRLTTTGEGSCLNDTPTAGPQSNLFDVAVAPNVLSIVSAECRPYE